MIRLVLDTNVFVSAVLGGTLGALIDQWRSNAFVLVIRDEIAEEYLGVLRRSKFHLPAEMVDAIMAQVFQQADFVMSETRIDIVAVDATDNKFLETALDGQAVYVVSGDRHLLSLKFYQGVEIITAREFLAVLEG